MPIYDYKCTKCEKVFEKELKIADRKIPTESTCVEQILYDENPTDRGFETCGGEITQLVSAPGFAYDNIGPKKPDAAFNDKLREIKKAHKYSTVPIIE